MVVIELVLAQVKCGENLPLHTTLPELNLDLG